ncbi:thiamine pyrophosphate-binding protein [Pseudogemmobacter sp. W21_MBD1_M6]|uniref:thiamine pyrophosphate-binding protein n=1 Tax=Pseudogemmobacter sp. W21_MBD1_M6 TaxID=3240271 RepID=UPI003F9BF2FD
MTDRKTYEILADAFLQEGVAQCFALLGDANMNWATALAGAGCGMVYVRHEHCAVSAAMSYARATGDVGVATVTCGPGVTQIMTALPAAVRAHIPLVIFAGEAPLKANWYNQAIDQAPFVTACGAAYHALHHPDRMAVQVRDAFLQARTERRPVVLGVPFDLQAMPWTGAQTLPAPSQSLMPDLSPVPPHPGDIAGLARLVGEARRIVVIAGLGAVRAGAGPACRALAEGCDALLATTLPARGLFHDDPFNLSIAGGFSSDITRSCLAEADLVIAVGASLASHTTDAGKLFAKARVVQIDTAPAAVSQGRVAAQVHVRADARLGVEALTAALGPRDGSSPWRTDALADRIRTTPADSTPFPQEPGLLDPRDVVSALDAALPLDWEMVNSSGHCSYYFAQMPGRPVAQFHTIREFGAIGNGISYAMGVAAARPDRTVVLFDGDGSLLMHVQELETILRHRMNILICVLNDGAYGSEIHKLRAEGVSDEGAVFGRPDLGRIARGFGAAGVQVDDLADLPRLVAGFDKTKGAAIWDFHISDKVFSPVIARAHPPVHR